MYKIISDIHLGAKNCETDLLDKFLDTLDSKYDLIINGDLVDHWKLHKWSKKHLALLQRIRERAKYFIAGNHEVSAKMASQITGLEWRDGLSLDINNKKIFICHGHIWDEWVGRWPVAQNVVDFIYNSLHKDMAKKVKKAFKKTIKCISHSAAKLDYDAVICGHTHFHINLGKYWNTGCWTEEPGTWVEIDDFGQIRLDNLRS